MHCLESDAPRHARASLALPRCVTTVHPISFSFQIEDTVCCFKMLNRASTVLRPSLPVVAKRNVSIKVRAVPVACANVLTSPQNIVYGSPEAKEAGEVEQLQHSKLVARQKYLHVFECAPDLLLSINFRRLTVHSQFTG